MTELIAGFRRGAVAGRSLARITGAAGPGSRLTACRVAPTARLIEQSATGVPDPLHSAAPRSLRELMVWRVEHPIPTSPTTILGDSARPSRTDGDSAESNEPRSSPEWARASSARN
jgi:hypothetical protein